MPAEAGFGGCYVSIITLDNHKNNIKSNRDVLQNHDIYLRLVFWKAIETEKEGVYAVSKCDQPDGSTHLPMHMCFSQDDAHSTP